MNYNFHLHALKGERFLTCFIFFSGMVWFVIRNPTSGLVLDATDPNQVKMGRFDSNNTFQMWSKTAQQGLYCKGHGNKRVLDLHVNDFNRHGWGKVYLFSPHHGKNQQWTLGTTCFTLPISSFRVLQIKLFHFRNNHYMPT